MAKTIISEGKTTAEAIEKGLKEIGLPKELVEIKVLEENKKSFFDILAPKIVKVELKEKEAKKPEEFEIETTEQELEEAKQEIDKFLKEFIEKLANETTYTIEIKDKCLYVSLQGENVGNIIGYRGEALNSLQVLLTTIASKNSDGNIKVILDIGNYKDVRKKTLEELARKVEKTVKKTGKSVTLEPMTAYERKILHTELQNSEFVKTYSIGEGDRRRVVIAKK